jgi:hypothetical protein
MKSKLLIVAIVGTVAFFSACSGNNTAKNSPDTADNTYGETKSIDTSKTTTTTGDAPNLDNSGSGGTKIDTPKN